METTMPLLAYLGPETVLPIASILATILGFVLMFWRFLIHWIKKPFLLLLGKSEPPSMGATADNPITDESLAARTAIGEGGQVS